MKIEEYKHIIKETAIFPEKVDNFGLAYAWLGLLDETEEFMEKCLEGGDELLKELGDVCWYVAAVSENLGFNTEKIFSIEGRRILNGTKLVTLSGGIKKFYRDGKPIDRVIMETALQNHLLNLFGMVAGGSSNMSRVLAMNYAKLSKRKVEGKLKGDGDNR